MIEPGRVVAVYAGSASRLSWRGRSHRTAFVKQAITGPVKVLPMGIAGDEHVYHDHGGLDQALLVYSHDHYDFWHREHGLDLPDAGAFAENLTVTGLTESDVCIGDTFSAGGVIAQVTSPRTPCYKIGVRYGDRRLPRVMQDTGYSGYLLRVLTPGEIEAGDSMRLIARPDLTMTVAEAGRVVARDRDDWDVIDSLVAIPELADAMRDKLLQRLRARAGGDDQARLFGEGEGDPET